MGGAQDTAQPLHAWHIRFDLVWIRICIILATIKLPWVHILWAHTKKNWGGEEFKQADVSFAN